MANRIEYQIVGRYMNGKEVTGYHLQSLETGKSGKYTREQVCYLVGRGQVTNCEGQIYQDKVLLRGVGMSLDSLPVQQEDGELSRTDSVGHIRKNTTAADAMTQLMLTAAIVSGRNVVGYVVSNSGGASKNVSRADVIKLASENRLGNAKVQNYNGQLILRGLGCNLNELPQVTAESLGINAGNQEENKTETLQDALKKYYIVIGGAMEKARTKYLDLGRGRPVRDESTNDIIMEIIPGSNLRFTISDGVVSVRALASKNYKEADVSMVSKTDGKCYAVYHVNTYFADVLATKIIEGLDLLKAGQPV